MSFVRIALASGCVLAFAGCMRIDTNVQLHQDGSATLTEKLRFSRQLLELSGKEGSEQDIASLLGKPAAEERLKYMGKGATLASHDVKEVEGGARESTMVVKIGDIGELIYVSPFLAYSDYAKNNGAKFTIFPIYKTGSSWEFHAGNVAVALRPLKPPQGQPRLEKDQKPPDPPAPAELQILREIQPAFRDMLKEFKVQIFFEGYAPMRSHFGIRGRGAAPKRVEYLSFSGGDMDKFGAPIIENQEVMLEILRGNFAGWNIADHGRGWPGNLTLPVFHNWGSPNSEWRQGDLLLFAPSKPLFDRFFAGKTLHFFEREGGPRLANFDEIGYKGK